MKIFIIGVTGFIGLPIAKSFVRNGHKVYGLTRSESKAKELIKEEVFPIVANVDEIETWIENIIDMDVIVEAVGGTANISVLSKKILENVVEKVKNIRKSNSKIVYIYSSGTWVHGNNDINNIKHDVSPVINSIPLVSWRSELEQKVINSNDINGIVIRPGLLYGKSGSLLDPLFTMALNGKIEWVGDNNTRWSLIHCDDLAELYIKVAESFIIAKGNIFDAVNNSSESVDDIIKNLIKISNANPNYKYVKPKNRLEEALSFTNITHPTLARDLLKWYPKKLSLVDGMQQYYNSWNAYKN